MVVCKHKQPPSSRGFRNMSSEPMARVRLPNLSGIVKARVHENTVSIGKEQVPFANLEWQAATTGQVYGIILNDSASLETLGQSLHAAPYKAPPQAPILYVKPHNTHAGHGTRVRMPTGENQLEIAGTLGIVFNYSAARCTFENALEAVRGYTVVIDLSIPHSSVYRPPIREKCFNDSCIIGPYVVPKSSVPDPDTLEVHSFINGSLQQSWKLEQLVRKVRELIVDVSSFTSFQTDDVLLVGIPLRVPKANLGDTIAIEIPGVARLEASL